MGAPSSNLSERLGRLFAPLLDLLYPPSCLLCKKSLDRQGFCPSCTGRFEPLASPKCTCCGEPFLEAGNDDHLCGRCITAPPPFDRASSCFLFAPPLTDAIHRLKYSGRSLLAAHLGRFLSGHEICRETYDLIVPVPLHIRRLRERGFNQSILLAEPLSKEHGIVIDPFLLMRTKETPSQTGMGRKEREENMKGAFSLEKAKQIDGARILLVDDVYTTGATARECSRVLKKRGAAKVNVLTLARVPERT